jgi:hypothetical protein
LSHSYTKADTPFEYRFMLRAKVLVGQIAEGNPSLRRPPEIRGQSHKLYDSCVDVIFTITENTGFRITKTHQFKLLE